MEQLPSSGANTTWTVRNEAAEYTQGYQRQVCQKDTNVAHKQPQHKLVTALRYCVLKIDETADIYTPSMQQEAERVLRRYWVEWITSKVGQKLFGPKRCSYIVSWLSGNRVDEHGLKAVGDFIRFMLDTSNKQAGFELIQHRAGVMVKIDI